MPLASDSSINLEFIQMRLLGILTLLLSLIACNKPNPDILVVGTIAGPETQLVETAATYAKKNHDLTVKIVEFSDYNLPNEALVDGSLDANVFQHQPYLDAANKAHGFKLKSAAKTFIYPSGIYSKKHKTLKSIPDRAIIALPNDPSNELRALQLLKSAGLITLKKKTNASIDDIATNPKKLIFKEINAAQLPRVLDDVDAAIINTTYAIEAGLSPSRDALYVEPSNSPYANIIVVRENNTKIKQLDYFIEAMHSQAVRKKANVLFGADAIAAWNTKYK